jgi:hypothetical protein
MQLDSFRMNAIPSFLKTNNNDYATKKFRKDGPET